MKKLLVLTLAMALALGLAACFGGGEDETTEPTTITEAIKTTVPAPTDPDFDAASLFERLEGYWNTPYGALEGVNGYGFVNFRYEDGRPCLYTGVYESEGTSFGNLAGGKSIEENMATLNFWSPAEEDGLWAGRPEMTETVSLDLTSLKDGSIRIKRESPIWSIDWITYTYGGETFAEAEQKLDWNLP